MNYYDLFKKESMKKRYAGTEAATIFFTMEHYKDKSKTLRNELEKDFEGTVKRKEHHQYFVNTEFLNLYEMGLYDDILSAVHLNRYAKEIFDKRILAGDGIDTMTIFKETGGKGGTVFFERMRKEYEDQGFTWYQAEFHNQIQRFVYKL